MEIVLYEIHPHVALLRELLGEVLFEDDNVESDDESYLVSLDPKDWKNQDHYAVLGLKKKRYLASSEDIRKAYRKKVLDHHPDKRRCKGEVIQDDRCDYFFCITMAFEILGNPNKRLAYDSVDPIAVDDSVPSVQEIKNKFFTVLPDFFHRKSRWSKKQPVPNFGNATTNIEDVHRFYEFWEEYDSCRDFSYMDEEDKEKGEDRFTRRAIERQNRMDRARRKAEEVGAVRSIVHLAKDNDPRILAAKKAAQEAKEAKRLARLEANRMKAEAEKERARQEAEAEAAARAASEECRRQEAERIRKERDQIKIEAKRERRQLRSILVEHFNYFITDDLNVTEAGAQQVKVLADMDLLCQRLSNIQLHDLNDRLAKSELRDQAMEIFNTELASVQQELQTQAIQKSQHSGQNSVNVIDGDTADVNSKWTNETIQLLIKAVNILPAGTPKRWEAVAAYVNQHAPGLSVTGKDVLKQAKTLKQNDLSVRKTVNVHAFDSFSQSVKDTDAVKNVAITKQIEAEASRPWNVIEQRALEQALKTYPAKPSKDENSVDDRWQRIADVVGTRTRRECMLRCKELSEQVRAKKAALAAVNKPMQNASKPIVKSCLENNLSNHK